MKKKLILTSVFAILFMSVVTAAWVFQYDETVEGIVHPEGKKLDVIWDLDDFEINTSTGAITHSQNLTLDSKKDDTWVDIYVEVNKTLTEVECPDYENDCTIEFWNTTHEVNDGDHGLILKGVNVWWLNVSCVEYSCGQNMSTRVRMTPM